ncbi:MAG TPA: hypothetical protein VH113_07035, partial [Gemmatimonadales bacterium]|nr:hypothetical protein [Gemmatimonadales bacterium]
MCDLRALGLVLIVALPAGAVAGQAVDTARLHYRADSLLTLWRQANTLALAQHAVRDVRHQRAAQVSRTTAAIRGENPVQAGDLMVIADYPDSIPLREAATRAWSILSSTYGHRASSLVQQPIHLTVVFSARQHVLVASGRRVPHGASVDELERTLLGIAGQPAIDPRLSNWLGNTVQPVFDTGATRSNVYVQLVTAGSIAALNCFQGAPASCVTALQLSEDSDFVLTAFDAAGRRQAAARSSARSRLEPADLPAFTRCVDERVDSACVAFLRALGQAQIPRPLGVEARNLLVSTALEMGGAGAFDRLTGDSTASVSERVSLAAGASIDRVVDTWRSNVMGPSAAERRATRRCP